MHVHTRNPENYRVRHDPVSGSFTGSQSRNISASHSFSGYKCIQVDYFLNDLSKITKQVMLIGGPSSDSDCRWNDPRIGIGLFTGPIARYVMHENSFDFFMGKMLF